MYMLWNVNGEKAVPLLSAAAYVKIVSSISDPNINMCFRSSLVAQQMKVLVLSLLRLGSLWRCWFDPWPGNFYMPQPWPPSKMFLPHVLCKIQNSLKCHLPPGMITTLMNGLPHVTSAWPGTVVGHVLFPTSSLVMANGGSPTLATPNPLRPGRWRSQELVAAAWCLVGGERRLHLCMEGSECVYR